MTSVFDVVSAARKPQEGMLALAKGLDLVLAQLAELRAAAPADEWGEWEAPAAPVAAIEPAPAYELREPMSVDLAEKLGDLARQMAHPGLSDVDRGALQAQMNLLLDPGRAPDPVDHGVRTNVIQGDGEAVVELPPVTPERFMKRIQWAQEAGLNENMPGDEDWEKHYAKGGPMWLYLGNRDYVLGLNEDLRRRMVSDVLEDSATEAHELSADILKDMSSGGLPEFSPDT